MHSVCVAKLHVTVSYIKILRFPQQRFNGKFISVANIQNVRRYSCKVPGAALKQKNTVFTRVIHALF
jgi:hypothetical protein